MIYIIHISWKTDKLGRISADMLIVIISDVKEEVFLENSDFLLQDFWLSFAFYFIENIILKNNKSLAKAILL
jgi:hypothetical protein